jgi:DNA replication protein DnaC
MKTWHFLFRQGRMKFGKNFQIEKQDIPVIRQLIVHAIQEHDLSKKYGLDLNKGILLTGPVGCGKTSWMHLIQCLMEPSQKFLVKSSRDIAFEFNKEGYDVINNYGKRHRPICLDDIGVEQNIKFYGNECNTIAEVLLHRYDLQVNHGIITYATTNLSASQLEQLYGNRVRSRLRSMFNLIAFPETSTDKRR